jgi:hypothetical protein
MANEITFTGSLSVNKPSVMSSAIGRSWTGLLFNMNGNPYFEGAVTISSNGTVLSLGQVTQPHYAAFYSNPTFNNALTQPSTTVVSGAVNAAGLVRITDTAHGYQTGDVVTIAGVGGTTEANGTWPITKIDANTFDLLGSAFVNAFASNGTALLVPSIRIRNGSGGADLAQLFIGQVAIIPLLVGSTPYAICNMTGQLLEYLIASY